MGEWLYSIVVRMRRGGDSFARHGDQLGDSPGDMATMVTRRYWRNKRRSAQILYIWRGAKLTVE